MEICIRWYKGDKETRRAARVLLAICFQGALVNSGSVLASSFYVTHLMDRGKICLLRYNNNNWGLMP